MTDSPLRCTRRYVAWSVAGLILLAALTLHVTPQPMNLTAISGWQGVLLALATLVSEDLTCIAAGELLRSGNLSLGTALGGCVVGIYLGDMGLWLLGRGLGARVLQLPWVARRLSAGRMRAMEDWFDKHAIQAIVAARFLPGTRLPTYIAAGALGRKGGQFAALTLLASLLWVPLIVMTVSLLGEPVTRLLTLYVGSGFSIVAVILVGLGLLRLQRLLVTPIGRAKLHARVSRLWRWEFWPMWAFYPPVVAYIAWLSLKHRSFAVVTAANPGIRHGGFIGESKYQILSSIHDPLVSPTVLLPTSDPAARMAALLATGWAWPIILKPDVGERGAGVKLARSPEDAERYLATTELPLIAQPFHDGPYEAGIFYARIPGQASGQIFSITDKHFSHVTGDGKSTLEELIWAHPRYRMQAATFLRRHADQLDCVLDPGQSFRLATAGNHCQGTLFRDGAHLITPALESRIDQLARTFDGFYFGRFDVRYREVGRFCNGEDLTVIELNGVTSESTNIYDPGWPLWKAYLTLGRQWKLLFDIAAANRAAGHRPSTWRELAGDLLRHRRSAKPSALAD